MAMQPLTDPSPAAPEKTNRLAREKSPYLLQHAQNPVDWYPWGSEAFQKARDEDRPIFLSIGYATCHWCHVMAHESFEDRDVARLLNESFVSIKVDREERPDVDKIYMDVCQAMTGSGGWPLTVFLTADGKPFFAGTYFPKTGRMGRPGLVDVLRQVAEAWKNQKEKIVTSSEAITQAIQPKQEADLATASVGLKGEPWLKKGFSQLQRAYDTTFGGFGGAPKFPTPHNLTFLLRWFRRTGDRAALEMVENTLTAMRHGGIYDQVGFGFHRYSVDERWFVPHFEKMLYDQALLALAYTEAYQVTGNALFAKTAHEIFTYVLRDMTDPQGGFYSAEDADSEGEEGLFYLWTAQEVEKHLGPEVGGLFCRFYDIVEGGTFEKGWSIPRVRMSVEAFCKREGIPPERIAGLLEEGRSCLFDLREKRVRPLKDDKILASWNGLMIAAFAKGFQVFGDERYREAALRAAQFILTRLRREDGRLLRRYRDGEAAYPAYLDDYAFLAWGLTELYGATFDVSLLETAVSTTEEMFALFWDRQGGGFFFTGTGNEALVARSKDAYDGALPSGNSVAALNCLRLARMTGDADLQKRAENLVRAFAKRIEEAPLGYTHLLQALDFMVGPGREVVLAADAHFETGQAMVEMVQKPFRPKTVLLVAQPGPQGERLAALAPFVKGMVPVDGQATAYVCRSFACLAPVTGTEGLLSALGDGKEYLETGPVRGYPTN